MSSNDISACQETVLSTCLQHSLRLDQHCCEENHVAEPSIYSALDTSKREIRLLEILPVDATLSLEEQSMIRCRLFCVSQDDNPEYTALSYAWGDPSRTMPVHVNGQTIQVTESLEAALKQFRSDNVRIAWADALCINQSDDSEKNHQVQKMSSIYTRATRVIAWLGVEDDSSGTAIAALRDLGDLALSRGIRTLLAINRSDEFSDLATYLSDNPETLSLGRIRAVSRFLARPWWQRVWVIPEIVLANSAFLTCSSDCIGWTKFCAGVSLMFIASVRLLCSPYDVASIMDKTFQKCFHFVSIWSITDMYGSVSLESLYVTSSARSLHCSDPRDRLFAFLGLLTKTIRDKIVVDYSASCEEVYLQAAKVMYEADGPDTLRFCATSYSETTLEQASWVPNWTAPPNRYLIPRGCSVTLSRDAKLHISPTTRILRMDVVWLGAVCSDTVVRLSDECYQGHDALANFVENQLTGFLALETIYGRQEDCLDAIGTTLIVNYNRRTWRRAGNEELQSFRAYMGKFRPPDTFEGDENQWKAEKSALYLDLVSFKIVKSMSISTEGYMCAHPDTVLPGDRICVPLGGNFPILLRPGCEGRYRYAGQVYVHGIINGELMERNLPPEEVEIY